MSVWGFGGLSTLKADAKVGDNQNGMGGSFGIGYNYAFTNQWVSIQDWNYPSIMPNQQSTIFRTITIRMIENSEKLPFLKALKRVSVFLDTLFCILIFNSPDTFAV